MMKKYLDSNVFLYPLLYEDEKAKSAVEIIRGFVSRKFVAYTCVLTWDELVYVLRREKGKEVGEEEGERFLKLPNLIFLDVKKVILDKAQKLMRDYNLKPRDAIHAASAILNGVNEIVSDDEDFDKIKEIKRIKLEGLGEEKKDKVRS